jgi:hypothetical protein
MRQFQQNRLPNRLVQRVAFGGLPPSWIPALMHRISSKPRTPGVFPLYGWRCR